MSDPSSDVRQIVAAAEAAWKTHRTATRYRVEAGQLTEADSNQLCGEGVKAAWLRNYLSAFQGVKW